MPTIAPETLTRFSAALLEAVEMTPPEAARCAASLVESNMRGYDSHGVMRLPFYIQMIETGEVDLKAPIRPDRPVTIGRADNNDIVLAFSTVSLNHLKIEMIGASLPVTDLGSANGTLIDGREIAPRTPRSIPPDTPVEIGTLRARIRLE